jgi:hypothetical protein
MLVDEGNLRKCAVGGNHISSREMWKWSSHETCFCSANISARVTICQLQSVCYRSTIVLFYEKYGFFYKCQCGRFTAPFYYLFFHWDFPFSSFSKTIILAFAELCVYMCVVITSPYFCGFKRSTTDGLLVEFVLFVPHLQAVT